MAINRNATSGVLINIPKKFLISLGSILLVFFGGFAVYLFQSHDNNTSTVAKIETSVSQNKEQITKVENNSTTAIQDSEKRVIKRIDDFETRFNFFQNQVDLNHAETMRVIGNLEARFPKN